jgi:hypothetical protein
LSGCALARGVKIAEETRRGFIKRKSAGQQKRKGEMKNPALGNQNVLCDAASGQLTRFG